MDAKGLYRQQSIETATPGRLISLLYHGAIARIISAEESIARGAPAAANDELQRAQAIVFELRRALDFDEGGEIARNLAALYTFCIEGLLEANTTKRSAPLGPVRRTLEELAEAWDQMTSTHGDGTPAARGGHPGWAAATG